MTTLAQLADRAQILLNDTGESTWSQSTIETLVNQAIKDYSLHFPRHIQTTITTTANDRKYDLPGDFLEPVSVEYPTSQDPPEYLKRRPYLHPDFWEDDGYFDIVPNRDDVNVDELWISEKPADSETITVIYHSPHNHELTSGETVTVPDDHHHILIAHVLWQATLILLNTEQASPTASSSSLMIALSDNAAQYKYDYDNLIFAAKKEIGETIITHWNFSDGANGLDRIY